MKEEFNYKQVFGLIDYGNSDPRTTVDFEEFAKSINLTLTEFDCLFTEWAGGSLKEFLRTVSVANLKRILQPEHANLFETPKNIKTENSLSHVEIEQMTPAEYQNGGSELTINYSYADSRFGKLLIAATPKGICYIAYCDEEQTAFTLLKAKFPKATYVQQSDLFQEHALLAFQDQLSEQPIELHLKGTDFQLKVWEALLKIPMAELSTYGKIAAALGNPNASRAVGTAIGSNPVAFLIPCHRVVQGSGNLGGYMWGMTRKQAIIGFEGIRQGSGVSPEGITMRESGMKILQGH